MNDLSSFNATSFAPGISDATTILLNHCPTQWYIATSLCKMNQKRKKEREVQALGLGGRGQQLGAGIKYNSPGHHGSFKDQLQSRVLAAAGLRAIPKA